MEDVVRYFALLFFVFVFCIPDGFIQLKQSCQGEEELKTKSSRVRLCLLFRKLVIVLMLLCTVRLSSGKKIQMLPWRLQRAKWTLNWSSVRLDHLKIWQLHWILPGCVFQRVKRAASFLLLRLCLGFHHQSLEAFSLCFLLFVRRCNLRMSIVI